MQLAITLDISYKRVLQYLYGKAKTKMRQLHAIAYASNHHRQLHAIA